MSKQKIDKIGILKLTKLLVVLSGGRVSVLNTGTLGEKKVLVKSGATTFTINSNDYIAIAVNKKVQFYFFDLQKVEFLPALFGKSNEFPLHDQIYKMGTLPFYHFLSLELRHPRRRHQEKLHDNRPENNESTGAVSVEQRDVSESDGV